MIPDITDMKWTLLVKGQIDHKFKAVPASMLVSRLSRELKKDDSPGKIREAINEAYEFFKKYEKIFESDIVAIFGK